MADDVTPTETVEAPPADPWMAYLEMLGLADPTLAATFTNVLGGLDSAVPPAGEYVTSQDYITLYGALSTQYVTEVIEQYEAILGPTPELYDAAVAMGALTPEAAAGMQAVGVTETGSLDAEFAAQGGLRAVEGPHAAAEIELMGQAIADMQMATQRASSEAYTLAQQTTQLGIDADAVAGEIALGMLNAGVSNQNAKIAAEAAVAAAEAGHVEIPPPPEQPAISASMPPEPREPEWWETLLPALAGIGVPLGAAYISRPQAPQPPTELDKYKQTLEVQDYKAKEAAIAAEKPPPMDSPGEIEDQQLQSYGQDALEYGSGYDPSVYSYGTDPAYMMNAVAQDLQPNAYDTSEYGITGIGTPTMGSYTQMPAYQAPTITTPTFDWSEYYSAYTQPSYSMPSYSYGSGTPSYNQPTPSYDDYGFDSWSNYVYTPTPYNYSYDTYYPDYSSATDYSSNYNSSGGFSYGGYAY